jgi:hypothetical protein
MAESWIGRAGREEIKTSLRAVLDEAKAIDGLAVPSQQQGMDVIVAQVQAEAQAATAFAVLSLADEVAELRAVMQRTEEALISGFNEALEMLEKAKNA